MCIIKQNYEVDPFTDTRLTVIHAHGHRHIDMHTWLLQNFSKML